MDKMKEQLEQSFVKPSIEELYQRLCLEKTAEQIPAFFELNNEVYNPYINTQKVFISTSSEEK